jgi:hypothetical protein
MVALFTCAVPPGKLRERKLRLSLLTSNFLSVTYEVEKPRNLAVTNGLETFSDQEHGTDFESSDVCLRTQEIQSYRYALAWLDAVLTNKVLGSIPVVSLIMELATLPRANGALPTAVLGG